MKWLKLFVFVIYCVLLYLVMYRFSHEKKLPDFYQSQFLSIGSIGAFVIGVVAICFWLRRDMRRVGTGGSYKRNRKEALD